MNWAQWSGERENDPAAWVTPVAQYGTIGSVLAVEFATDLGLPSDMAPGLQGQFQLQITAQYRNTSNAEINATLFIIIVSEGSMTIPGLNSCTKQLGVITKSDILNSKSKPSVTYDQIRESQFGGEGNFLSGLKDFGSKINNFLKESKLISTIANAVPLPGASAVGTIARNLGYGQAGYGRQGGIVIDPSQYHDYGCGEDGGVMAGGRELPRSNLRNRLSGL